MKIVKISDRYHTKSMTLNPNWATFSAENEFAIATLIRHILDSRSKPSGVKAWHWSSCLRSTNSFYFKIRDAK